MGWLDRRGGDIAAGTDPASEPEQRPEGEERPSLGLATLFDRARPDEEHVVLDLGWASEASFGVHQRYARHIRFAGILEEDPARLITTLDRTVPAQPDRPYDLILAWDVLDRLPPDRRRTLIDHLAARARPGALMLVLVDASERALVRRFRFQVADVDRVRYEPAGPEEHARAGILPAEVERILEPFEVVRAFTSRTGMREYVGILR